MGSFNCQLTYSLSVLWLYFGFPQVVSAMVHAAKGCYFVYDFGVSEGQFIFSTEDSWQAFLLLIDPPWNATWCGRLHVAAWVQLSRACGEWFLAFLVIFISPATDHQLPSIVRLTQAMLRIRDDETGDNSNKKHWNFMFDMATDEATCCKWRIGRYEWQCGLLFFLCSYWRVHLIQWDHSLTLLLKFAVHDAEDDQLNCFKFLDGQLCFGVE